MKRIAAFFGRMVRWIFRAIWRGFRAILRLVFRVVSWVLYHLYYLLRHILFPRVCVTYKYLKRYTITVLFPAAVQQYQEGKKHYHAEVLPYAQEQVHRSKTYYASMVAPQIDAQYRQLKTYYDERLSERVERYKIHLMAWLRTFHKTDPEVEFYPAVLEVVETPPSPLGRTIMHVIIAFMLVALLWACLGRVDVIATAQGKIVSTSRSKLIQPLEAGVIRKINVHDGQQVHTGDVLLEIDSTITESERDRLRNDYVDAALDAARLRALTGDYQDPILAFDPPPEASKTQIQTQKALLENQLNEYHAKLNSLDQQIAQNEGNRDAVSATIDKLNQSMPFLEEREHVRERLSNKGYGSKIDTLQAQQDLTEHQRELQVQQGRLVEATGALESLREQRKQAEAEFKHTNLDKLAEAEQKSTSLHEQVLQAAQKYRLQTLASPVDGTVQQLSVHTEGGVVTPAETLMVVAPSDSRLEIEAMISNRDIGFVHEGQEVEIKIDTFAFTRYGLLHGKVLSVSQDAIVHEKLQGNGEDKKQVGAENESSELAGQELLYAARISLDATSMDIDGRDVKLTPGMAVTAEVKTGHRHIIGYLLSPLRRHIQQSMREQ